MDELEISGKRYLSTKFAGKQNGYHSDYIGQLIRGGKVEGRKVGRAWYVQAESLASYLGKEPQISEVSPVSKVKEPAIETPLKAPEAEKPIPEATVEMLPSVAVVEAQAAEIPKAEEQEVLMKAFIEEEPIGEEPKQEIKIEINKPAPRTGGLTYVSNNDSFLPPIEKAYPVNIIKESRIEENANDVKESSSLPQEIREGSRNQPILGSAISLAVSAFIIFGVVSGMLYLLGYHTSLNGNFQTAAVKLYEL